ncbi:hypothetical protein KAM380_049290 [Aeromonas caviae]|nr:hypothetical protein KAM380_049290 [Aeromonas caviae]
MKVTKDLEELLKRIRLDHAEIVERFRFLDWSAEDARRLGVAAQYMAPSQQAFVDHQYRHLAEFSTPSALLRTPEVTARLKQSQAEYYQRLWSGPYDETYVNGRLRIGVIHQQIGLELKWYLGSYRLYLDDMLESVFGDSPDATLYSSLLKAVFFDMTLAIDTYSAAQHKALEDSEARFARALRGANDGLWDWHVDQDRLYVSERWASMLGLSRDSIGESSSSWFGRVHPDDLPDFRHAIDAHLQGQTSSVHHEYRIRKHNGDYIWVLVRGVAEMTNPGELRMAGSQSDISARKDAEQRLQHTAQHDPLTGLANRIRLDEQMQKTFRKQRKGGDYEALLFIDLDRFKLINDSLGHNVGDRVLVEVARRLKESLRPTDQLFRFGGDEFIVLLHDLTCDRDAEQISQRILDNLHQPLHMDGRTLVVSASIGIAPLHDNGKALDVLQAADLALYRAKSAGKARYAHYDETLQDTAQQHLELESALGQALQQNEFELYYQPIYHLDQPMITGRTYCGDQLPPYDLPDHKTRMTIKSQTHKGDGFNELRFEDELGKEEVFIHAQKDQNTQVNNNQSLTVGVDRTQSIGQDESVAIGRNRLRVVKANDTLKVGGGKNDLIAGDYEIEAGNTLRLKCGKTLIEMQANGTLNITCETFNLTGQQTGQINTPAAKLDLNPEGGAAGAAADGRDSSALKADVDGHFK